MAIGDAELRCSTVKVALRRALCVILTRLGIVECAAATRKFRRDSYSAISYIVCAAMKVTISFGDTADAAAKPQGRLRFSFGSAVSKSAMWRSDVKS